MGHHHAVLWCALGLEDVVQDLRQALAVEERANRQPRRECAAARGEAAFEVVAGAGREGVGREAVPGKLSRGGVDLAYGARHGANGYGHGGGILSATPLFERANI